MLKSYLKIAWRNLTKNKVYSLINVLGLAVALAVFIIIILFVRHELSYNQFFSEPDKIYRVLITQENSAFENINELLPEPVVRQLKELYPEVEHSVMTTGPYREKLLKGDNEIYMDGWMSAGPEFFSIFDFKFISGKPENALSGPNTVVITEQLANQLFETTEVVGKTITANNTEDYTITGVLKNIPDNTHFEAEAFAYRPPNDISKPPFSQWNMYLGQGYIGLSSAEQIGSLRSKTQGYVDEYQNLSEGDSRKFRLILQPVTDIHLYPKSREAESSRMFYIQVLLIVAGLILLIACINYMNMATARSAGRAREIGIRKTVGAFRWQVIAQVMIESIMTCFIAFVLAFLFVELFKPLTLRYFDLSLGSLYEFTPAWIGFMAGLMILVSILSGAYAAFYLSSFEPSQVLKGSGPGSTKGTAGLRKVLVVSQFSISIAIVIVSLLVSQQMDFIRTERLNGNDEQVMVIKNNSQDLSEQFDAFKNELLQNSSIVSASAGTIPNQISQRANFRDSTGGTTSLFYFSVKYDYLKTMGFELVDGRDFDIDRGQDSTEAVILNATAAQEFGYNQVEEQQVQKVQGKKLIGIVQDFHSHTLFDPIEPVAISLMDERSSSRIRRVLVRLNEGQIASGIDDVRAVWNDFVPNYPLNFSFMDTMLDQDYRAELRLAKIFNVFSVFSILIACLGLFGLAAFSAERRTKEIGIRKVLGATITNIVTLLSKDFLKLVILGFIIAVPIAYFGMSRWLADFAYKITIGPSIFLLAGGAALLIALATVSWQSIRAALANPVESLRSE